VKKEQKGRESPRRLKSTVGCNASKRKKKIVAYKQIYNHHKNEAESQSQHN
jgi:hypothetical protein